MRANRTAAAALGAVAAMTGAVALSAPAAMSAESAGDAPARTDTVSGRPDLAAIGITEDDELVSFETDFPHEVEDIGDVVLADDDSVIGIDIRVQDGLLYAVGSEGGVYTVSMDDATATKVSALTVDLEGATFGVDFNPAADRLRVISDTGQNLRHDLNTDTTTLDTALTYPAVPPGTPTPGVGITAAAYTNNDLDANTGTTLYDIDTTLDQVVLQSPANSGLLSATGKLTIDAGTEVGFDIYTKVKKGRAFDADGYAVISVDGDYGVYKVRLFTGEVKKTRGFSDKNQVVDLALRLNQR